MAYLVVQIPTITIIKTVKGRMGGGGEERGGNGRRGERWEGERSVGQAMRGENSRGDGRGRECRTGEEKGRLLEAEGEGSVRL